LRKTAGPRRKTSERQEEEKETAAQLVRPHHVLDYPSISRFISLRGRAGVGTGGQRGEEKRLIGGLKKKGEKAGPLVHVKWASRGVVVRYEKLERRQRKKRTYFTERFWRFENGRRIKEGLALKRATDEGVNSASGR